MMRVKVVRCAEWFGIVRESLLLRVEVVAQVLESAAEEMLTAAGKSHCQEGGREGELFVQERVLNSQGFCCVVEYDIRLIQLRKQHYIISTDT